MDAHLKQSPLLAAHIALGARLVPFAGWNMPVQYTSILDEHRTVRESAGIFDISHMGQFVCEGPSARPWLDTLLTNRLARLAPGEGQYTLMPNANGGVIDDLIIYRTSTDSFFLVVNASMIDEDFAWLCAHLPAEGVTLTNHSDRYAGMAIQGPRSADIFSAVFPDATLPLRNGIALLRGGSVVCRTGYTGEDGFEFFCPADEAVSWWDLFRAAGATACGLGARDTLRLEMCYPLNGNDLSPTRTPIEAGLGFFCDLEKTPAFTGQSILARQKAEGPAMRLVAILATGKGAPPRAHYPVLDASGNPVGELSSGALSPTLGTGIAMAYLPAALAKPGTPLLIDIRGRHLPAEVVKKPFLKR